MATLGDNADLLYCGLCIRTAYDALEGAVAKDYAQILAAIKKD